MESKFYGDGYAQVTWRAEDIQTLKPNWSLEKCQEWLESNENRIQDRLTELGWEVIDSLMIHHTSEGDDDE